MPGSILGLNPGMGMTERGDREGKGGTMPQKIQAKLIIAALFVALAVAAPADAATEKVLHAFAGGGSDGSEPTAGLIASNGNLYGTTANGGGSGCGGQGCGTVFKISPDGTSFAVLHSFAGSSSDGAIPAELIASGGNFYGMTNGAGGSGCGGGGCGTVFKISPDGTSYAVLHSFAGSDGAFPGAGLIAHTDGNLYGTTSAGGGSGCSGFGCGTVFKISPDGTSFAVLHAFAGGADGDSPIGSLTADSNGNLYGMTHQGGGSGCDGIGCGTVFKISPDGTSYAVLHSLTLSDGALSAAGPIVSSGNLYGTTQTGPGSGCSGVGCGVVFKLSLDGTSYVVLHSFTGGDGRQPRAGLIADSKGNLFGTTAFGGASDKGVVFKLSPGGMEKLLYSFCGKLGCSDGNLPEAGLVADSDGNLFGTTTRGGGAPGCFGVGCGVVFKLQGTGFGP
jgi:uncharacterized repeat protein (TIGR03803 family)